MKIFSFILLSLFYLSIQKLNLEYYQQLLRDAKVYFPQKDGVLILTSETIEEALKIYPKLAVLFYAPWCPHCKALYPEIVSALKDDEMKKMGVVFGRVDIEYNTKVRDDFKVYGMPTVLYFENGERKDTYGGGRTANSIVEWFYKRLVRKTHLLKSLDEIKAFERPAEHKYVYFGKNPEKIKEYENFIDLNGNTLFGLVEDEKLIKSYGKSPDTVVLFKNFDDPPYVDIKNITVANLKHESKLNQFPLMYENCDDLLRKSFNYRIPSMILFRNDADKQKTPNLDKTYLKMANNHRSKILFCKSDINSEFSKRIIRAANVTKVSAEKNEPSALIFDFVKGFNKWRIEDFFNECNDKNMEQFLQDWVDEKIKPPIKSEEIPTKQEGPVYKLVNKSFQKEVIDNDLNVFVKFYSPNCPHCVKLKPTFEELADKLRNNKYIRIAEYNLKDNDFDWFQIRSYPTLILFKAGEKHQTKYYNGNRTVEDMMSFVLANSGNSEEIIRKKEEAKRKKEEEERKKKEEEEKKRREEERKKKEEEEKKRREEEARKRREEEERKRKLEEEKKRKEEEAKKRREEEERKRKLEEEKKRKEEELRKKKLEEEKKKKEEEAKKKESNQNNKEEKQKKKSEEL